MKRIFDHTGIEKLADLLLNMAQEGAEIPDLGGKDLIDLTGRLYGLAGTISKTFSFDRQAKVERLEALLDVYR